MKAIGALVLLLCAGAQTVAAASASTRHLVYEFGYNTPVASAGNGTGTTTIEIKGPAPDGGLIVSGTDYWWNTARPRATNTCEVYADGTVNCSQAPYAISPIQLTIFPLLGSSYFNGLSAAGTSSWKQSLSIKAAILPGASGFAGQLYTWSYAAELQGKGPIAGSKPKAILIQTEGSYTQQGGRYLKASSKERIAYDPVARLPVVVRETRTHLPQRSVYSNDLVELKLIKASR
jgi:hypothetical protein